MQPLLIHVEHAVDRHGDLHLGALAAVRIALVGAGERGVVTGESDERRQMPAG